MNKLFSLKDKNIIVTGALGLLGREHVKAIAKFGGSPILIDLDQKFIDQFADEISKNYDVTCYGFKVDITNENEVLNNLNHLKNKINQLDGLVNNAANNPKVENNNNEFSRLENFPVASWDSDINVSLKGSFLCAKYYGAFIAKNPNGGSIINISSDLGIIAPNQNIYKKEGLDDDKQMVKPITYSIVKHGIVGLTKYLSTYWADRDVRCNAICPGGVKNGQDEEFLIKINSLIPLGRMANKDEYQGLLIFLLSNASSYINGSIIAADGGRSAW